MTSLYEISKIAAQHAAGKLIPYADKVFSPDNKNLLKKLREITTAERMLHVYAEDMAGDKVRSYLRHSLVTKAGNFLEDYLISTYLASVEEGLIEANRFQKTTPGDFLLISRSGRKYIIEVASSSYTKSGADRQLAGYVETEFNRRQKKGVTPGSIPEDVTHVIVIFDRKYIDGNPDLWGYGQLSNELYGDPDVLDFWKSEAASIAATITAFREMRERPLIDMATDYMVDAGFPTRPALRETSMATLKLADVIHGVGAAY